MIDKIDYPPIHELLISYQAEPDLDFFCSQELQQCSVQNNEGLASRDGQGVCIWDRALQKRQCQPFPHAGLIIKATSGFA